MLCLISTCLSFLVLILAVVKLYIRFLLWEFPSPSCVKLNTDGTARVLQVLLLLVVFYVRVWENLLVVSLFSLMFILLWLLSFMDLYMLLNKLKRWVLLVDGLDVILSWFVLHFLPWLMFIGCSVIGVTLVLTTVKKSGLGFLTFFVKGMHVVINFVTYALFI